MSEPAVANHVGVNADPALLRGIQHFDRLAREGKIVGFAAVGIGPNGEVHCMPALPQTNPIALQLAIGGLFMLIDDVKEFVKALRAHTRASPVIIPGIRKLS